MSHTNTLHLSLHMNTTEQEHESSGTSQFDSNSEGYDEVIKLLK